MTYFSLELTFTLHLPGATGKLTQGPFRHVTVLSKKHKINLKIKFWIIENKPFEISSEETGTQAVKNTSNK